MLLFLGIYDKIWLLNRLICVEVNVLFMFKKVSLLDLLMVIEFIGGISFFWINKKIIKGKWWESVCCWNIVIMCVYDYEK